MEIRNRIIKTEPIRWRKLEWLQGNLKTLSRQSFERLKQSLVKNSFVQPFNVWEDGMLWCLDGHHRKRAMEELEKEGYAIPDCLPANFIDCKDMKEAKKLLLVYSSIYARISEESLYEFLHTEQLDFDAVKLEIDLPDISMPKFEAGWMDENPEAGYLQDSLKAYKSIVISFLSEADYKAFTCLIKQNLTENTKHIWFPKQDFDQIARDHIIVES